MSQVLIVDPNPVNLDVAQEAFNLCYTKTVHEAARTVRENRPDLVTTARRHCLTETRRM